MKWCALSNKIATKIKLNWGTFCTASRNWTQNAKVTKWFGNNSCKNNRGKLWKVMHSGKKKPTGPSQKGGAHALSTARWTDGAKQALKQNILCWGSPLQNKEWERRRTQNQKIVNFAKKQYICLSAFSILTRRVSETGHWCTPGQTCCPLDTWSKYLPDLSCLSAVAPRNVRLCTCSNPLHKFTAQCSAWRCCLSALTASWSPHKAALTS